MAVPLRAAQIARLAYFVIILIATLGGLQPDIDAGRIWARALGFFDVSMTPGDVVDGVRNVVLFAGWGAVWIVTGPGSRLARCIGEATLSGIALSLTVEGIQLLSSSRTSSALDLATNAAGALAGALAMVGLAWMVHRARGERSFVGIPAFIFAAGYGTGVALEAFLPLFESDLLSGPGGGALARLGHALAMLQWGSLVQLPLLHLVLFAPAGALAVAALVEAGVSYRSAWPRVAAGGAMLALLMEVMGGAADHPIVAGSIVIHATAVAIGAWAAAQWLPGLSERLRGRSRPIALLGAYGGVLLLWSWRPFLPETSASAFLGQFTLQRFTPLAAHAMRFDLFSAVDLLRQFALLFPVGALLAVWPLRTKGPLSGPLPAIYAAFLIEAGQLFLSSRLFDVTDALVTASAVAIGWVVVRRSGFRTYGEMAPVSAKSGP